jgi:hypothetical protein
MNGEFKENTLLRSEKKMEKEKMRKSTLFPIVSAGGLAVILPLGLLAVLNSVHAAF